MSEENNLESVIKELERYGDPAVNKRDSGWNCKVAINAFEGVDFSVWSDFDKKSPLEAAEECRYRVRNGITKLLNAAREEGCAGDEKEAGDPGGEFDSSR